MVKFLAVGAAAFLSSAALAEGGLSIQVNHKVLSYKAMSSEVTPDGGTATTTKTTMISSYPGDTSVLLGFDNWALYLFPGQADTPIQAGYMVMPELEVGVNLAFNSTSVDKPKNDQVWNNYGLYGIYYLSLGTPSLEMGLAINSVTNTAKVAETVDGPAADTKKESGLNYKLGVDYVLPVAGAFSYVAGLSYEMSNMKDTVAETKTASSTLEVTLASARLDF